MLAKDEAKAARLLQVMYNLLEAIALGANLLKPFMPSTCAAILSELGTAEKRYEDLDKFGLTPEYSVKWLFYRVNLEDIKDLRERIAASHLAESAPQPEE